MSQTTESETLAETLEQAGATEERLRLMTLLVSKRAHMAADYRNTIKHTGGLLTQSMTYAYSKGLEDAFKLLSKPKENNEKPV